MGVSLSDIRDLAAAEAFFRSAWAVTGGTPDRIAIGGHDAYPRAFGTGLGDQVTPGTDRYLNGHVGQDHRGTEQRHPSTGGLNSFVTAPRFGLVFDEIRTHLRPSLHRQQPVQPAYRQHLHWDRLAQLLASWSAHHLDRGDRRHQCQPRGAKVDTAIPWPGPLIDRHR